jgi:head-tail adaptor
MLKTKADVMKVLGRTYRDKIILKEPVKTPDGQGGFKPGWDDGITVGAYFRTPKLSTQEETGTIISEMTQEIKIQNRIGVPDVCKGWRAEFGTKTFSVEHVYNDDYDQTKVLVCKEVTR